MSLKHRCEIIRVLIILGSQAPIWWLKDLGAFVWPELKAKGAVDILVTIVLGISAVVMALWVQRRMLEPILTPEARDEP